MQISECGRRVQPASDCGLRHRPDVPSPFDGVRTADRCALLTEHFLQYQRRTHRVHSLRRDQNVLSDRTRCAGHRLVSSDQAEPIGEWPTFGLRRPASMQRDFPWRSSCMHRCWRNRGCCLPATHFRLRPTITNDARTQAASHDEIC